MKGNKEFEEVRMGKSNSAHDNPISNTPRPFAADRPPGSAQEPEEKREPAGGADGRLEQQG